jgi:ribonuclease G
MAKNILVINVDIRETRVALIEGGIIAELHIERSNAKGTLGNVYLGKVSRVLPGMQAAFIDIGQERAAFLHVEDLIRPDDFEAYLAGKRGGAGNADDEHTHGREPDEAGAIGPAPEPSSAGGEAPADPERAADAALADLEAAELEIDAAEALDEVRFEDAEDISDEEALDEGEADHDHHPDGDSTTEHDADDEADDAEAGAEAAGAEAEDADGDDADGDDADGDDADDADGDEGADDAEDPDPVGDADEAAANEPAEGAPGDAEAEHGGEAHVGAADSDLDLPRVEGETPVAGAEDDAARRAPRSRSRRGSRGRRRSGRTADRRPDVVGAPAPAEQPAPPPERRARGEGGRGEGRGDRRGDDRGRRGDGRGGRGRDGKGQKAQRMDRRAKADPLRVSKTTPIREVVREGQEVVVQVSKEPIGTKGARVTSHISLPGRYVVYLPTVEHVGISKRIGSDKERGRLREVIESVKPPVGGLIVRTVAEGLTKKGLKADIGYLVKLWGEIAKKKAEGARAPALLSSELDLVLKTARDLFTDDIEEIVIDNRDEYVRLRRFVEMFMPERVEAIHLYEGEEPIFDAYGIEDEIGRALSRKVPLPSGGHLIIDQAEALTAIDVNTGRFVGKGSKDLEDTILKTNLEAVEEIAYQLRFRNIGGLIILDLIDMERAANREKVRRRLEQLLAKDKAKTTLNRISELGLIEMTRKRTRESLGRQMNEPCFYCDGTGNLQSKQTVAYEILRQIKRERMSLRGYSVVVNAHPAVVDLLKNEERTAVQEAERRYQRRIELVPRREYHLEQFDLIGK